MTYEKMKYRIAEFLKLIEDRILQVSIQGAILWELRIAHATYYRKCLATEDSIYFLDPDQIETIVRVFNERVPDLLGREMTKDDILNQVHA